VTPLYLLAFDHRSSFRELLGLDGPDAIEDVKNLVYEGFALAAADGLPGSLGILVDEELGASVAARARTDGHVLAMPVERSGRAEFELEYGGRFGEHIEAFDPAYVKVLVRYNPDGDAALNARQSERLRILSDWLVARGRELLFELLVPPTAAQLERFGDAARYDATLRPELTVRSIRELQDAGVEPAVWKLEGFDGPSAFRDAAETARRDGRDDVTCIVLGRGAGIERVSGWLSTAAGVPGYAGFAVGRTLWWDALGAHVRGEASRADAATSIAAAFTRLVQVYETARPSN
jgi:myo-inositol catabolism protein IolC